MVPISYGSIGFAVLAFLAAAVAAQIARVLVRRALASLDVADAENKVAAEARAKQLIRALTLLAYGVALLVTLSLALDRFGIDEPTWKPRMIVHWALTNGVNIVIVFIGAFVAVRTANLAIDHLESRIARRYADGDLEWQRAAPRR